MSVIIHDDSLGGFSIILAKPHLFEHRTSRSQILELHLFKPVLMEVGVIRMAGHTVSIVSIVFGIIGMRMGLDSIHGFIKPSGEKMFWWFAHMQGMIGSYIAAMTAFSAVNLSHWFGTAWWAWLWPTIVGVPAIAIWTRYYRKKFSPKPKIAVA